MLSEENGRVILIAPTVGLVDQHLDQYEVLSLRKRLFHYQTSFQQSWPAGLLDQ